MKKKSFYNEEDGKNEDELLGKIHKNFYLDIEWMRLNAEKERICHYRDIARKSAIKYYKILKKIIERNLIHVMVSKASPDKASANNKNTEKKSNHPNFYQQKETKINWIYYITDYIKLVIENGNEFIQDHLYEIIETLIFEELSDEVIETLNIVIVQFEFDKDKFKEWVETNVLEIMKAKRLYKVLDEFTEHDANM